MIREKYCTNCKGYVYSVGEVTKVTKTAKVVRFACPLCRVGLDLVTIPQGERRGCPKQ